MTKKTNAEWKALDARLARELLNCVKWDELTDEEQNAIKRWRVWRHYDGYWWQRGEGTPRLMCGILLWQPNVKVAQALMAVDALRVRGVGYALGCAEFGTIRHWCKLFSACEGWCEFWGWHEVRRKAICLALVNWLDAQKEKQDD